MGTRQHAFGINRQRHWSVEQLGKFSQLRRCVDGTATGQNQRTSGFSQQLAHAFDGRRRSAGAVDIDRHTGEQVISVFDQHVQRNFDVYRTRTTGLKQRKSTRQHHRQFSSGHQGMRERRNTCDQCALIRQLMQLAAPAAQLTARLHTGDHQHRDRIGVGLAHGGGDVGHARPGDDEAHSRFAAGARIAVSHETGALLMPRRDVANARTRQPAIQLHGVYAGNAEHLPDPITFE
ncbi:hypothetical protein PS655_06066 [Pseudomonas fluorescens]|uniref:Uncharacterized protein n=1 Tax=Pseudomonas fluorescens TaxID=294 RepID=A0A5E6X6B2_PSEFL|nr:hypothetical protein PS655_05182 [Pseudomonas fluorescens]VVN48226.1 hypothetical protein PS655_06066 [Pseudomonas fluorescens]